MKGKSLLPKQVHKGILAWGWHEGRVWESLKLLLLHLPFHHVALFHRLKVGGLISLSLEGMHRIVDSFKPNTCAAADAPTPLRSLSKIFTFSVRVITTLFLLGTKLSELLLSRFGPIMKDEMSKMFSWEKKEILSTCSRFSTRPPVCVLWWCREGGRVRRGYLREWWPRLCSVLRISNHHQYHHSSPSTLYAFN